MPLSSTLPYALIAGVLPALIWLWFWLREDREHPEPRFLIVLTFCGGLLAVIISIFAEKWVSDVVSDTNLRYILWAAIEEAAKFAAVGIIALTTRYYDEPLDAMIYCAVAALGFAAFENTLFVLDPLSRGFILNGIVTGNMRFIGATLVHVVSSATAGFALGYAFYGRSFDRLIAVLLGLISATALHSAFNLSIISGGAAGTLQTFAWVWGAVVILIVLFEEIKAVQPRRV